MNTVTPPTARRTAVAHGSGDAGSAQPGAPSGTFKTLARRVVDLRAVPMASSWAALGAILVFAPYLVTTVSDRFLACLVLVYAILALSWNLTLGVAGVANFAHLAFFAIGAYAAGVLDEKSEVGAWWGLLFAGLVGGIAGTIAFLPVVRLRGIYVALVTFVFSQLCFYLVLNQSGLTGGSSGLVGLPDLEIGGTRLSENGYYGYYVLLGIEFLVVVALIDLLHRSSFGRSLIALRDREHYAISRGVPPFRQQLIAFVVSAAVAGFTGGLYASLAGVVAPELFGFGYSTVVLSIIFLGGIGSRRGPIVAAVVITWLSDYLNDTGPWRLIVISSIIVVTLWIYPAGLSGAWQRSVRFIRRAGRRDAPPAGVPSSIRSDRSNRP